MSQRRSLPDQDSRGKKVPAAPLRVWTRGVSPEGSHPAPSGRLTEAVGDPNAARLGGEAALEIPCSPHTQVTHGGCPGPRTARSSTSPWTEMPQPLQATWWSLQQKNVSALHYCRFGCVTTPQTHTKAAGAGGFLGVLLQTGTATTLAIHWHLLCPVPAPTVSGAQRWWKDGVTALLLAQCARPPQAPTPAATWAPRVHF